MSRKDVAGNKLFYGFSLDDRVPQDHLLRRVRQVIDHQAIWQLAEPYYSSTGAPSVDPAVVLKMALLGYFYGITSERRLAEECRLNLAFLWFLGYDLDEEPPNHSILSKAGLTNRKTGRFDPERPDDFGRNDWTDWPEYAP
jgi:transposase